MKLSVKINRTYHWPSNVHCLYLSLKKRVFLVLNPYTTTDISTLGSNPNLDPKCATSARPIIVIASNVLLHACIKKIIMLIALCDI